MDGSYSSCGDMTISELRKSLRYVKHGGVPLPRSGVRSGTWGGTASGRVRGDLRIMVRASPSGVPHLSSTPQPAGVPLDRTGASAEWGTPPVSFGAPPDGQMSIAASEGEVSLSRDDDSAALPPLGVVALSEPDPKMTAMLSRAAENVGLVWNPPLCSDPSRLDEWFLGGGRAGSQGRGISALVVQERHLWLCLNDTKEQEKVQFLNAPVSQTGLFGDTPGRVPVFHIAAPPRVLQ